IASFDVFQNQVELRARADHVERADDVGMFHPAKDFDLAPKAGQCVVAAMHAANVEGLECNKAPRQQAVPGLEHNAVAAATKKIDDYIFVHVEMPCASSQLTQLKPGE